MNRSWITGVVLGAAAVALLWAFTTFSRSHAQGHTDPPGVIAPSGAPLAVIRSPTGFMTLHFIAENGRNQEKDETIKEVTALHFYPEYVFYFKKDMGGVLLREKTSEMMWWHQAAPSPATTSETKTEGKTDAVKTKEEVKKSEPPKTPPSAGKTTTTDKVFKDKR